MTRSFKLKRKCKKIRKRIDRISDLPNDITRKILECLPLREAAKTSILSTHWRYVWTSMSQLILDRTFFRSIFDDLLESDDEYYVFKYILLVNKILLGHVGPIHKFVLYLPEWYHLYTDLIIPWIKLVRANGVKELILDSRRIDLSSCFFSCVDLTHLTLTNCQNLTLPLVSEGFPSLVSLKFENFVAADVETSKDLMIRVVNLISNCPELESLHMSMGCCAVDLNIHSPKLQDLCLEGFMLIANVSLRGATAIKRLELNVLSQHLENSQNIGDFFSCLPNVEELKLRRFFWFATERFPYTSPNKLPKELENLRNLQLVGIPLHCGSSISLLLCLLHSTPNLELLSIDVDGNYKKNIRRKIRVDDESYQQYHLKCLKNVYLMNITMRNNELQLIKLLLATSPVLREISIDFGMEMMGYEAKYEVSRVIARYCRASPHARVHFIEEDPLFD